MASENRLIDLIKNVSLIRLRQQSRLNEVHLVQMNEDQPVFSHWMTLVLVSAPSVRIVFKSHFLTGSAQSFAAPAFGVQPIQVTEMRAIDFMREFCNLTAGGIKAAISPYVSRMALSLPVMTRGFDEIFFKELILESTLTDQWSLRSEHGEAICSVTIDVLEEIDFSSLKPDFTDHSDAGIELF